MKPLDTVLSELVVVLEKRVKKTLFSDSLFQEQTEMLIHPRRAGYLCSAKTTMVRHAQQFLKELK